jgi:peptidoglycan/LPS O-acetylase OafA/YrhL
LPRLHCLDGLRGALAAYVMAAHMAPFVVMPAWLAFIFAHGGAAVDAFFVLSGLVIVQSLAAHGWRRRRFLAARAWRIFPVFLWVFAIALALQAAGVTSDDHVWDALPWIAPDSDAHNSWSIGWPDYWLVSIVAHLTMTHGLFPDAVAPNLWVSYLGAAWSLSTEWQFYALAALVAPWLRRGTLSLSGFAFLLLALAAAGAAWQARAPDGITFSRAFLPNKAAYFALGVASAALLRGAAASGPTFVAVLIATLLLGYQQGAGKLVVPLLWVACLAAQRRPRETGAGWLRWLLTRRAMLWLGAISYPLYLVNEPAQQVFGNALANMARGDRLRFAAFWVPGALLLPIALAWLLHVGIEVPTMRRFRAAGRVALAGVAPGPADSLCAAPGWVSRIRSRKSRTPTSRSRTG